MNDVARKPRVSLKGTWRQALASFLSPIVLILIIRWALIEPYVIPSGSMIPNLLVHDHVFVTKSSFGLRVPFSDHWLVHWSSPRRGDVIVFRFPQNPSIFYIKRLIGLPGDRVVTRGGSISVNGEKWPLAAVQPPPTDGDEGFTYYQESTEGHPHVVRFYSTSDVQAEVAHEFVVPEGEYFFMGDNRDQSSDGRAWGFVPEKNLMGRAWLIWLSCDEMLESAKFLCDPSTLRWNRFFKIVDP